MNVPTEPRQTMPGRPLPAASALILSVLLLLLTGCAGQDTRDAKGIPGYRKLDPNAIPDAVPRVEPRSKYGNMASYSVRGRVYRTKQDSRGHLEHGLASWYGMQFNGQRTSSGERYDMYGMTAAHKTLPLPSYARVTNLENGRSAVVRINDRGPFHSTRVIDLSYAAATKIGVFPKGTATVEIRGLDPAQPDAAPGAGFGSHPGFAPRSEPTPFLADNRDQAEVPERANARAIAQSLAIANRGSAPPPRAQARPADTRERAAAAAFAAVDAEPTPDPRPAVAPTSAPRPAAMPPLAIVAAQVPATDSDTSAAPSPAGAAVPGPGLFLQVGAFGDPRNAERLRERLTPHLAEQVRVQRTAAGASDLYKVRVGPLGSENDARRLSAKLSTLGVSEAPRLIWN